MLKKLRSNSGESLVEILIASLVIAAGVLLFVTMSNSSFRLLTRAEENFSEYNNAKNVVEEFNGATTQSGNMKLSYGSDAHTYINVINGRTYDIPVYYVESSDQNQFRLVKYKKRDG